MIHTRSRLVPDPMMTDAEYLHQQRIEAERAERTGDKINLDVGKVWVEENPITRIGALAYIRRRAPHQERAAERFKQLYEARYGSGVPAMDPSRIQVDTSPIAHDSGMAAKIDRTYDLDRILTDLTKDHQDRIIACVVLCIPCDDNADTLPSGHKNRRHVKREVEALLDALDALAVILGFRTRT